MKRVLIIGGGGFVGSHLVDVFRSTGVTPWVFDNFTTGKRALLGDLAGERVIEGDILDGIAVRRAIKDSSPDVVYHLAAIHHIPTCEEEPEVALRTNIEGTQVILRACGELKVPRVVFTSSGAVYDILSGPLSETTATSVRDVYGISKLCGEHLVAHHLSKRGGEVVIARLFNCVGNRETNNHLIPDILSQVVQGKRQIRLGNLEPRRDYVHVEDAAAGFAALATVPTNGRLEIFNIASGIEHSVLDLVNLLGEVIGEPIGAISVPELRRRVDRPGQLGDISKLQAMTPWKPRRNLKQALKEAWDEALAKHKKV